MKNSILLLLILFAASCVPQQLEQEVDEDFITVKKRGGDNRYPASDIPDGSPEFQAAFRVLANKCLSCHTGVDNPKGNLELQTDEDWANSKYVEAGDWDTSLLKLKLRNFGGNMPPLASKTLTTVEVETLKVWVNGLTPPMNPPPPPPPVVVVGSVKFQKAFTVIKDKCVSCHTGAVAYGDFSSNVEQDWIDRQNYITSGDWDNSKLRNKLTLFGGNMPPSPGTITSAEAADLQDWIDSLTPVTPPPPVVVVGSVEFQKAYTVLKNQCISCHTGAVAYGDFSSNVEQEWIDRQNYITSGDWAGSKIRNKLKNFGGNMPTTGTLTNDEVTDLQTWVDSLTPVGVVLVGSDEFKAAYEVLKTRCFDCHDTGSANGDFNVTNEVDWKTSKFVASTWGKALIRNKLKNYSGGDMPPDPIAAIPTSETVKLRDWINQLGASDPPPPPAVVVVGSAKFQKAFQVINDKCISCHTGAVAYGDFTSNVEQDWIDRQNYITSGDWANSKIRNKLGNFGGNMPTISSQEVIDLQDWIDSLTPVAPPAVVVVGSAEFQAAYTVLHNKCLSCHSGAGNPNGQLDDNVEENWLSSQKYVKPKDWNDSFLKKKLKNYAGGNMPPDPSAALSAAEITALETWVTNADPVAGSEFGSETISQYIQMNGDYRYIDSILKRVFGDTPFTRQLFLNEVRNNQDHFGGVCDIYTTVQKADTTTEFANIDCYEYKGQTSVARPSTSPVRQGYIMRACEELANDSTSLNYALSQVKNMTLNNNNQAFYKATKVIADNCLSCHGSASGRSLAHSSVDDWLASGYVTAGNTASSTLWTKLKANGGNMPSGTTLTAGEVTDIQNFILALGQSGLEQPVTTLPLNDENIKSAYMLFHPSDTPDTVIINHLKDIANTKATLNEKWITLFNTLCLNPTWQNLQ